MFPRCVIVVVLSMCGTARAQVEIRFEPTQIPVGPSEVRILAQLPADTDEDLGIAAVLVDLVTAPGLTATEFVWGGGLASGDAYFVVSTLPHPQTAYFGPAGLGQELPRGVDVLIGTLHLIATAEGGFDLDLNMEMAEDESFVSMAVVGDAVTLQAVHTVIGTTPPIGAIDARQPTHPDGTAPAGWSSVVLQFNGGEPPTDPARYAVAVDPPSDLPVITGITAEGTALTVVLDRIIPTGSWTRVEVTTSATGARLGFLPGDVNGDGRSGPRDVLTLIDVLNGVINRPPYATDLDRSGNIDPADILRHLDLLNGAGAYEPWNGRTLPRP